MSVVGKSWCTVCCLRGGLASISVPSPHLVSTSHLQVTPHQPWGASTFLCVSDCAITPCAGASPWCSSPGQWARLQDPLLRVTAERVALCVTCPLPTSKFLRSGFLVYVEGSMHWLLCGAPRPVRGPQCLPSLQQCLHRLAAGCVVRCQILSSAMGEKGSQRCINLCFLYHE